jgi:hypothetical protein
MNGFLEMLTARATEQGNGAALEMLARLRDGGPKPSTEELLAQLGGSNPMLGFLAQRMAQRAARAPRGETIDVEPLEVASQAAADSPPDVETPAESSELFELRERVVVLTGEAQTLGTRLGRLADALGACGLCWGEDHGCRACRGRGRPGYALPDEQLFEELVVPALRLLRANRAPAPRTTVTPLRAADSAAPAQNIT